MKKLNYIQEKIKEVKKNISTYDERVKLHWWEECILDDLKKELSILREIEEDLKQLLAA